MPVASAIIEMRHERAPKDEILEAFKPLMERSGLRALGHDELIGVYDRAGKKTAGGLWTPETNREDQFQGKVGIVLSMGPMASPRNPDFVEWFGDDYPKIGDWVGVNVRDGFTFLLGNQTCRQIEWRYLRFAVDRPDLAG